MILLKYQCSEFETGECPLVDSSDIVGPWNTDHLFPLIPACCRLKTHEDPIRFNICVNFGHIQARPKVIYIWNLHIMYNITMCVKYCELKFCREHQFASFVKKHPVRMPLSDQTWVMSFCSFLHRAFHSVTSTALISVIRY